MGEEIGSSVGFAGCDCAIVPTVDAVLANESPLVCRLIIYKLFHFISVSAHSLLGCISTEGARPQRDMDD